MSSNLNGQKAIVVGAYGGMGGAVSTALCREGVYCVLLGRNEKKLAEITAKCNEYGDFAFPSLFDISDLQSIQSVVNDAIGKLGGLNYLINFAGVHNRGKAYEADMDAWDEVLDINFRATYYLARHALPEINKTPGGAIIKIGSLGVASTGGGMHLAGMQAIQGYLKAVFEDVREYGTKVCTIRPGFVSSQMSKSDRLDSDLMIQPEDIARTVLFVLEMPGTTCPTNIELRPQCTPYKQA